MRKFVLPALVVLVVTTASAQDFSNCSALLQHGIYDKYRETSGAASSSQYRSDICTAYTKYQQDKLAGTTQGSYGLFSGGGSLSTDQLLVIGQTMCSATGTSSYSQNDLNIMSDRIDPAAATAFTDCAALNAAGLKAKTTIRESDAAQMTLDVFYTQPIGGGATVTVTGVDIRPAGSWTCAGPLWDMRVNGHVDNHSYSMSCGRVTDLAPTPAADGKAYVARDSTVSVLTDVGSISRSFAPLLAAPPPPPFNLPVGTIIAFNGTAADAAAQTANGWWICDGRTVTDALSPIFKGKPTPDLTNRFLQAASNSVAPMTTGGSASWTSPTLVVNSETNGFNGNHVIKMDPRVIVSNAQTWPNGAVITSSGGVPSFTVTTTPPYYAVINLIRVR